MAIRVNPQLIEEVEKFGAEDVTKCYHCGTCTAVCTHAEDPFFFPRRSMRNLQMGLTDKLKGSLEPWLCYYCGECSEQCPREAEPGETMMSLRRWLTAAYDFTGLSRLFYRSWKAELGAILVLALLTGLGFSLYGFAQGNIHVYDGPTAFLPSSTVHIFDWIMGGVLALLLAVNASRMWWFILGRNRSINVSLFSYIKGAYLVPLHFFTQKRYVDCSRKRPWAIHLALMLSYVAMLVLIMFFLHQMQAGPAIDWRVHALGYLASLGLIGTTIYALRGRWKKTGVHYEHSHESDWIFLILLLIVAVTGVLQHALHRAGLDVAANIMYVIHLMGVVPMLVLEVPFSKWSHMVYRPLAMYFAHLYAAALAKAPKAASALSAAQPAQVA